MPYQCWMAISYSFARTTTIFLVIGLGALLAIVGTTFWLNEQAQLYFTRVVAARDARSAAVELRSAIQAAESSQRGFLVTGNQIYLAPYDTAKTLVQRRLAGVIDDLKSYNPAAAQHLENVVREKISEMDNSIALMSDRRQEEAMAFFNKNLGKALMDEANVFLAGIVRAADDRLTTAAGEARRSAAGLRWVSILGGIVIIAVVSMAAATAQRYTRDLLSARDQIAAANAELEEKVAERTSDLARANDEIQRFAHIVTHDLRAPLVNIMGFAGELENSAKELEQVIATASDRDVAPSVRHKVVETVTTEIPEAVGFIRSSAKKMDSLVSAVLKLSREGRRSLDLQRIDLEKLVVASADAVKHQLSVANGRISFEIGVREVVSDRLSLEQIVGNLLDNAVKYRSPTRPLRIEVRTSTMKENGYRVEVADNGQGIAEREQQGIFEMFSRSGSRDQPGEGIGLTFVQALVRNLGGQISLDSTPDVGTTFTVTFPGLVQTL